MAGGCYRPPDQEEPFDEVVCLQLREASRSEAQILLGNFSPAGICWKSSTASCKQPRRVVECVEHNFLFQVTDSPARGEALLDLLLPSMEELIREVKTDGSLGWVYDPLLLPCFSTDSSTGAFQDCEGLFCPSPLCQRMHFCN